MLKLKKSGKYIKLLLLLIIITLPNTVKGYELIGESFAEGGDSSCNILNNGYTGYIACYKPTFQFRFTLVDKQGKKIEGTTSVDFANSDSSTPQIINGNSQSISGVDSRFSFVNGEYYGYKYSEKYGDYNKGNYKYITVKMVQNIGNYQTNGVDDPDYYSQFWNEFFTIFKDKDIKNVTVNNNKQISFFSLFLYMSGYISKNEDIDNLNAFEEKDKDNISDMFDKDYYVLIEPTYTYYYNTTPGGKVIYKYGTASEIAKWMNSEIGKEKYRHSIFIKDGYLAGLSANFIYNMSCNLYETSNRIEFKGPMENFLGCEQSGVGYMNKNLPDRIDRLKYIENLTNYKNSYGVSVVRIKEWIPTPDEVENKCDFIINQCSDNDGIISVEFNGNKNNCIKNEESFKINGYDKELYCYDKKIIYNFSNIKNELEGKFKPFTYITIPNGKLTIIRECFFPKYNEEISNAIKQKLSGDAYATTVKLNFLDEKYKFEKDDETKQIVENVKYDTIDDEDDQTNAWVDYTIEIDYKISDSDKYVTDLKDNSIKILTKKNTNSEDSYISFYGDDNVDDTNIKIFGFNNNAITKIQNNELKTKTFTKKNNANTIYVTTNYSILYDNENEEGITGDNLKCNFKSTIDDDATPLDGGLQFRVISLSNPFPARDGTSRLPGTNWLDKRNYVYEYIDNNRAIQYIKYQKNKTINEKADPNDMYTNIEPMYVIDLDASTMKKIREYNKKHTYTDINLKCDSNNRQCTSDFLRNKIEGENIPIELTGECSDSSKYNEIKKINITEAELNAAIFGNENNYQSKYDLNKNLRNDTLDMDVLIQHDEKNTFFYTCADKTFLSGG